MKIAVSSFFCLILFGAVVVGCGSDEPTVVTDGADAQAIAEYEAAVAAAEGNMAESVESSEE